MLELIDNSGCNQAFGEARGGGWEFATGMNVLGKRSDRRDAVGIFVGDGGRGWGCCCDKWMGVVIKTLFQTLLGGEEATRMALEQVIVVRGGPHNFATMRTRTTQQHRGGKRR